MKYTNKQIAEFYLALDAGKVLQWRENDQHGWTTPIGDVDWLPRVVALDDFIRIKPEPKELFLVMGLGLQDVCYAAKSSIEAHAWANLRKGIYTVEHYKQVI